MGKKRVLLVNPGGGAAEYANHRKTGSDELDYRLSRAAFNNSKRGGVREVRLPGGGILPEGKRLRGVEAEYNKKRTEVRKQRPLTGVVTDRRGAVEIPAVSIPGVEKRAQRKKKS